MLLGNCTLEIDQYHQRVPSMTGGAQSCVLLPFDF